MPPDLNRIARNLRKLVLHKDNQQYAVQRGNEYLPSVEDLTDAVVLEHLAGRRTLGINLVQPKTQLVKAGAIGVDAPGADLADLEDSLEDARRIRKAATARGLPTAIEFTGRRGWRVWLFPQLAIPATTMRRLLADLAAQADCPKAVIYPAGESAGGSREGTGFRPLMLPCGQHRLGGWSGFLEETVAWGEDGRPVLPDQADTLQAIQQAPQDMVGKAVASLLPGPRVAEERLPDLFAKLGEAEPACMTWLRQHGPPMDQPYHLVNLTLARYAIARRLDEDDALTMAEEMARATRPEHPTGHQNPSEKVRNFRSVLKSAMREPAQFQFNCSYVLASPELKAEACSGRACPAWPYGAGASPAPAPRPVATPVAVPDDVPVPPATPPVAARPDVRQRPTTTTPPPPKEDASRSPMGALTPGLLLDLFAPPARIEAPSAWLNRVLNGGWLPGRLYLLGGPSGAGKTAFCSWAADAAAARGVHVLYVSSGMNREQLYIAALSRLDGIDSALIEGRHWADRNDAEATALIARVRSAARTYDRTVAPRVAILEAGADVGTATLKTEIGRVRERAGADGRVLVIVDDLGCLTSGEATSKIRGDGDRIAARAIADLKGLARDLGTAVVVVAEVPTRTCLDALDAGAAWGRVLLDAMPGVSAADTVLSLLPGDLGPPGIPATTKGPLPPAGERTDLDAIPGIGDAYVRLSILKNRSGPRAESLFVHYRALHRFTPVDREMTSSDDGSSSTEAP
jgi:hypothetical protein